MKSLPILVVFSLFITAVCLPCFGQDVPSSSQYGVYSEEDVPLLEIAFIDGVNSWLRRYNPSLTTKEAQYVKMSVVYDIRLEIELFVRDKEYEVKVTVGQRRYSPQKAQDICTKISRGVNKSFMDNLAKKKKASS